MNTNSEVENKDEAKVKDRDVGLDLIKIIAILMVILIHVSGKGFPGMGTGWAAVNFYESISRVSVPLFFMVTGALLLPRNESVKSILHKIVRVLIPLFAWSFIYLLILKRMFGLDIDYPFSLHSFKQWIAMISNGPVAGHLWYLYTLIAAYLFIPFMSSFYKFNDIKMKAFIMIVLFISTSIMPTIHGIAGRGFIGINWSFFYIYPSYFVAGAILWNDIKITRKITIYSFAMWVLSFISIALLTWYTSSGPGKMNELYYEYYSPFVFVGALSLFVFIKGVSRKIEGRSSFVVRNVSRFGFGVYLVHPIFIWILERKGYDYNFMNPWASIPILMLAVMLLSMITVYILQRIPYVRLITPN